MMERLQPYPVLRVRACPVCRQTMYVGDGGPEETLFWAWLGHEQGCPLAPVGLVQAAGGWRRN